MNFQEQVWITLLDKGLLALLAGLFAALVKYWLQRHQARKDLAVAIAEKRADAYARLWSATEMLRSTDPPRLDEAARRGIVKELAAVYFESGAAMYLSHRSASRFLAAKNKLADEAVPAEDVRNAFSRLRTQMKVDMLVYSNAEAKRPLVAAD